MKLKEVADLLRSTVNPQKQPNKMFNYLSIGNIERNTGQLIDFVPTPGREIKSIKHLFTVQDVLYSRLRPNLNKVFLPDFEGICATDLLALRPKPCILKEYLGLYLRSPFVVKYAASRMHGIQLPRLSTDALMKLDVLLPSMEEQRRIVARVQSILGRSRAAKQELDRVPELAKMLRMAILAKAFRGEMTESDPDDEPVEILLECIRERKGERRRNEPNRQKRAESREDELPILPRGWIWTTIGNIAVFVGSGITPRGGRKVYVEDGIPFIRSQNVYPDGLHLEGIARIPPEIHEMMSRTQVKPGDVLLNITGASIGRCTFVPEELGPGNVNQHVCIIRTVSCILPQYLRLFLNSPLGQEQIFSTQSGVTREGLNYAQIRGIRFPLAPIKEQKKIVSQTNQFLSLAYKIERTAMNTANRLNLIEHSVLIKAFQGELVHLEGNYESDQRV